MSVNLIGFIQSITNASLDEVSDVLRQDASPKSLLQLNYPQRISAWKHDLRPLPKWAKRPLRRWAFRLWEAEVKENPYGDFSGYASALGAPELMEIAAAKAIAKELPKTAKTKRLLTHLDRMKAIALERVLEQNE